MPGSELSCPRCAQKFTVQEGQIQYRCPPCRGVFETATGRYVFELPAARNAPPRAKLPAPMPLSDVDSSSLDSASSTPTEGGKKEADAPVEAPAAKRPRQEEGRAAGGAASSLQEMVAEVVQIKKKKLDAALKRQAEDTSTIRSKAEQVQKLREKLREIDTEMSCPICMENVAGTALACGHCFCCAATAAKCLPK